MRMAITAGIPSSTARRTRWSMEPSAKQIGGLPVIGAQAEAALVLRRDEGQEVAQVPGDAPLPEKNTHPCPQLFPGLLRRGALVVRGDPGGGVGVQLSPLHLGGVAVEGTPGKGLHFRKQTRTSSDYAPRSPSLPPGRPRRSRPAAPPGPRASGRPRRSRGRLRVRRKGPSPACRGADPPHPPA